MNRARWFVSGLLLTLLSGLLGCDVAVVALLASKNGGRSSRSPAASPDVSFNLWVAELGAITGAAEQLTLTGSNGNPDAKWTLVASATSSGEYTMPTPGNYDAILIQATDAQAYEIDAFEVIDATGTTLQTAGASTVFCSADVTAPELLKAQGPPDGAGALTAATAGVKSFIFMKRPTAFTTFRINLWRQGVSRISGDVEWAKTHVRPLDQTAGGADINSGGMTYLSAKESNAFYMMRFNSDGDVVVDTPDGDDLTQIESVTASVGSSSIAIDDANGDVFTATTRNAGDIRLQKFTGTNHTASWQNTILMGAGVDRVEANGLALNSAGELIVVGGLDAGGLGGGVNHYIKKCSKVNGSDMWASATPSAPPTPSDTANTYWYAVATDETQKIFTTGDLTPLLATVDTYTAKLIDTNTATFNGGVTEEWNAHSQAAVAAPSRGVSIGVDGSHNVYVAGFKTGTALDSFIIKYAGGLSSSGPHLTSIRAGNDEFLDIAVDADGTIYATGYETNSAQEDLVLYKIAPNGGIVWKRTVNVNNDDDRGVQVMRTATHVLVVGQVTNTGGDLDIHVRKYVK